MTVPAVKVVTAIRALSVIEKCLHPRAIYFNPYMSPLVSRTIVVYMS